MSTSARLLQLLSLLQARRDWPGEALAARLEVSPRTVRRDVERLRDMGYRVVAAKGPAGGYRLDRGSELPPLLFDDDQAVALAIALRAAVHTGAGVGDAALRALATVRQVLPSHLRHRVDALEFEALAPPGRGTAPPVNAGALLVISEAIRARREVRFDYASPSSPDGLADEVVAAGPRRVQPHHVVAVEGRWYVVAWEEALGDWRLFRVDRMNLREHAGARFEHKEVPGGDAQAFVSARFMGGRPGEGWPCAGRVVVHLPLARVAPFVAAGSVSAMADERCLVQAGSWSWGALAAWFARFDADLSGVEPPALAQAFAQLGRRAERAAQFAPAPNRGEDGPMTHVHPAPDQPDAAWPTVAPVDFWEERYAGPDRVWSGKANAALADVASGLTPGRALDLGCGEGADALWLASKGWDVVGVDISPTAVGRAAAEAAAQGLEQLVRFEATDLSSWDSDHSFDLVTSAFLHSPVELPRQDILRRASAFVVPGGHLLVITHAAAPPWSGHAEGHAPEFLTPAQERAVLALGEEWTVELEEVRERDVTRPDVGAVTLQDGILLFRREREGTR